MIYEEGLNFDSRRASVRSRAARFLNNHRHPNRPCLLDLHQRIRHVHIGGEYRAAERTGCVDRIGGGSLDFVDVMPRPGNRDLRRVGNHLYNLLPGGEVARHPRPDLDFARGSRIECQVQLAGNNLHDLHIARMPDLVGGQVERPFSGIHPGQINFRLESTPN